MTAREMFEAYFKNGNEFLYEPDSMILQHFKVHDILPNCLEMVVCKISLPNRPFGYFFKANDDIPYIYKVIQNFKK